MDVLALMKHAGMLKKLKIADISLEDVKGLFTLFDRQADETKGQQWLRLLKSTGYQGTMFDFMATGEWLDVLSSVAGGTMKADDVEMLELAKSVNRARNMQVQDMSANDWRDAFAVIGVQLDNKQAARMRELVDGQGFTGSIPEWVSTGQFSALFERGPDGNHLNDPWVCGFCHNPNHVDHFKTERVCAHCGQVNINNQE